MLHDMKSTVLGLIFGVFTVAGVTHASLGQQGSSNNAEFVSRAEWGARAPRRPNTRMYTADNVFIHHTDTPQCTDKDACITRVAGIQRYHMDDRGWNDIGYNLLVGTDGRLYEGRGVHYVGAHTYGHNQGSIGISVVGDYEGTYPSETVIQRIRDAIAYAQDEGVLSSTYELFGHRDGRCTQCPGTMLYYTIQSWPEYSYRPLSGAC